MKHDNEFWLWVGIKTIAGAVLSLWVSVPDIVRGLVLLMALDTVLGLWIAWRTRTLMSRTAWTGVSRKVATLFIIAAAYVFSKHVATFAGLGGIVAGFYCVGEVLSIVENAKALGVPVPEFLIRRLKQFQTEDE